MSMTPVENLPLVSTTLATNFSNGTTGVVDTSGKYAGVNDTRGKLAAGFNDTGGKLPPVSTTMVANNWNNIRLLIP
jgi:hypothetical protein